MQLKVKAKLPTSKNFLKGEDLIRQELDNAMLETADEVEKLFKATSASFEDKPVIEFIFKPFKITVFTENENYNRLNSGTSAHMIYPKPGGVLVFPSAFGRKTNPGQLYSMPGYKSSDMIFTRLPVLNPGFPARAFDKAIAKKIRPFLKRKVIAALKAGFKS